MLPSAWWNSRCQCEMLVIDPSISSIFCCVFDRRKYRKIQLQPWPARQDHQVGHSVALLCTSPPQVRSSRILLGMFLGKARCAALRSSFSNIMIPEMQSVSCMVLTLYIFRYHTNLQLVVPVIMVCISVLYKLTGDCLLFRYTWLVQHEINFSRAYNQLISLNTQYMSGHPNSCHWNVLSAAYICVLTPSQYVSISSILNFLGSTIS